MMSQVKKYSSNHILKVYKATNESAVEKKQHVLLITCEHVSFCKAFVKFYEVFMVKLL